MRLLLVEDERKLSDLVARALRAESYAVDVAEDGPGDGPSWRPTSTT
jgi:DNA-binding response OmpR family regulator